MCDIPQNNLAELPIEKVKEVIRGAADLDFRIFVFSGGEPLIRGDIFELISLVKVNGMSACVTSNGCLITDEAAGKLSRAGVDVVNVSVEGPKEIHDFLRGRETFDKAVLALENLRKHKIESTVAVMVSRYNYEHLPYICELAQKLGSTTIRFQPFSQIFINDTKKAGDFFIEKKDTPKLKQVLDKVIEFCRQRHIALNPDNYLYQMPFYLSNDKVRTNPGCGALWSTCSMNARGDVYPCWVFTSPDKLIGNAGKNNISKIWNSERHNQIRKVIVEQGCSGCMMSCYDDVFGKDAWSKEFGRRIGKIKDYKARQKIVKKIVKFLSDKINLFKSRYRFYKSYGGFSGKIFNRLWQNQKRRKLAAKTANQEEITQALKEIQMVKAKFKQEKIKYQ
jgi:radical SAM protein with 4Fe4S-binding SPASM domain